MQFVAFGNKNIEGKHTTVFEITQSASVLPKGDCVIGTRAAFDAEAIAALMQVSKKIKITLKTKTYSETIICDANANFIPGPEIIVRKNGFVSPHTLAINADKAAADFSKQFISALKDPKAELKVIIERIV